MNKPSNKVQKWCKHIEWTESVSGIIGHFPAHWSIRVNSYIWEAIASVWRFCPLCGKAKPKTT